MPTISGIVKDEMGVPCAALVRAHRRDTGALVAGQISDPATGVYSLTVPDAGPYVVMRFVAPAIAADPHWSDVKLGAHFNTDFSDSSTNENILTANGTAALTSAQSVFGAGKSLAIDGSNNCYVTATPDASLQLSGDFTADFQFLVGDLGNYALFSFNSFMGTNGVNLMAYNGGLYSEVNGTNANNASCGVTANTWHHAELSRSGNAIRLSLNGGLVATATNGTAFSGWDRFCIGAMLRNGSSQLNLLGNIAEFRITSLARHTADFTPPANLFAGIDQIGTPTENAQIFDYVFAA